MCCVHRRYPDRAPVVDLRLLQGIYVAKKWFLKADSVTPDLHGSADNRRRGSPTNPKSHGSVLIWSLYPLCHVINGLPVGGWHSLRNGSRWTVLLYSNDSYAYCVCEVKQVDHKSSSWHLNVTIINGTAHVTPCGHTCLAYEPPRVLIGQSR